MRVGSGIAAFDDVLHGGFPTHRTTVITGGPGSGKTMLGMQFLCAGVGCGEPGVFLSLEESREQLVRDFGSMEFPFADAIGTSIEIIDGRPTDDTIAIGRFDLSGLIAALTALTKEYGTRRLVIDALDEVFAQSADRSQVRREVTRLLQWLRESGITALLTVKATGNIAGLPESFEFAEFAADGVVQLRSMMHGSLLRRALRVLKLRGSNFVTGEHPYVLGKRGLRVLYTPIRTHYDETLGDQRCDTGVERLSRMLEGGYLRGTVTLISGLPGSSKTTFGAAFLGAGCANGERCLFVGFDEPAEQMIANARSVGIDLASPNRQGLLRVESFAAGAAIADRLLIMIQDLIDEHEPQRIVIDPISAWVNSGGAEISDIAVERLVSGVKARGLTAVMTAVSDSSTTTLESTPARISTIADTWIHLSFASHAGERNRTLTIVKSRGTAHSAQMREVILGRDGVGLAEVFVGEGEVLFGTERFQREQAIYARIREQQNKATQIVHGLEDERQSMLSRIEDLKRDVRRLDERRSSFVTETEREIEAERRQAEHVGFRRGVDPEEDE